MQTHFKRTLTLLPLIILGLAYMAPMAVFSPYGIVAQMTNGMVAGAYVTALIMILFTAYSYGKMVKAFPSSGSAYTYTTRAINPHLGFLVGWSVLMDYLFLPMLNNMAAGIFLSAAFPEIPIWAWVLLFTVIVTIINIFGIQVNVKLNGLLLIFQTLVTLLFLIFAIRGIHNGMGMATLFSTLPFYNPDASFSALFAGASVVCLSFLGFDAVTTLSEETLEPTKNVPKAIFFIALIGGVLFIAVAYFAQLVYPEYKSFTVADSASFEIVQAIGGTLLSAIFTAGIITSTFAASLSSHATAARLLYAMGREGVLMRSLFGYLHPRWKTPVFNVLVIGVFCLLALFLEFATAASFINFGALVAFTFVNLSVIAHYYVSGRERGAFLFVLLPIVGACFNIWIWASLDRHAILLGCSWIAIGLIYLAILTRFFRQKPPQLYLEEVERQSDAFSE
ncbi:UNVERIFIED_CONTAM: putrescine importer [Brevibacillus sp. OAP136]